MHDSTTEYRAVKLSIGDRRYKCTEEDIAALSHYGNYTLKDGAVEDFTVAVPDPQFHFILRQVMFRRITTIASSSVLWHTYEPSIGLPETLRERLLDYLQQFVVTSETRAGMRAALHKI